MKLASFQSSSLFSSLIILLLISIVSIPSHAYGGHKPFDECAPFSCGNIKNIKYPFWGNGQPEYCGQPGFRIDCQEDIATMIIMNLKYRVVEINPDSQLLRIARIDLTNRICPDEYFNSTLNFTLFSYTSNDENATLFYDCHLSEDRKTANNFTCSSNTIRHEARLVSHLISGNESELGCNTSVSIPILARAVVGFLKSELSVIQVLKEGFEVRWTIDQLKCRNCAKKGGRCGYNWTLDHFNCFSPSGSAELTSAEASSGSNPNIKLKVGIGLSASLLTIAIMGVIYYIYLRPKKNPYGPSSYVSQSNTTSDFSAKFDMERGGSLYGVQLFTYEQLEEATNNFDSKKELGEGGFGTVYHGKLQDGRSVAVKRLYENNFKRVEQFMNEVDLLTHLRHPHLVSLYGCTSRHSRELLLVYEYISNGTVADHVHGERAKPGGLPWDTRINIAVETASALAYLHRSDIIHRDVKTNNILLDDNFCVKVADFGLSRLFPLHATHISTAPQGTPGYVDPEYHECYQLTSKSDVYSFGVVLIELISSMPAVDITRHRHEINLSNMAINKIQSNALDELVDHSLGFDSDYAVRKMITAVAELAFQCLQSGKEMRPTMDEVLETLNLIKNKDYELEKKEEMGSPSDDVGLLKSDLPLSSPDTVMIKWTSTSTTPHTNVGLLKSDLPLSSPDTVMIKWTSTSTTPHTSG